MHTSPTSRSFFFFFWRLITLQYCSGFCHTLTCISHGCTCVSHPEPPSHLLPHPIPQGHPSAPALSPVGEGKGGMIWENIIETCILSYVKQVETFVLLLHYFFCRKVAYYIYIAPCFFHFTIYLRNDSILAYINWSHYFKNCSLVTEEKTLKDSILTAFIHKLWI